MKAFKLGFLASLLLMMISCSKEESPQLIDSPQNELSIYEMIVSSPEMSELATSLERAGLDATLSKPGNFTLFAPTNASLEKAGINLSTMDDKALNDFLNNHILQKKLYSADMSTSYERTMAGGPGEINLSMFIEIAEDIYLNGSSRLIPSKIDLVASNGIIHHIDLPLPLPSLEDHSIFNPEFSLFAEAVLLLEDVLPVLLGVDEGTPFTVFAPTNGAFMSLIDLMGFENIAQIPPETLLNVVLYHISFEGNFDSGSLTDGQEIKTLAGSSVVIDLSNGVQVIDGTPQPANVVTPDIQGMNGVIHSIDKVLTPANVAEEIGRDNTIGELVAINGDFSTLYDALKRAGLMEVVSDPSADFTLFAPNNAAFAAFLESTGLRYEDIPTDLLRNVLLNHVLIGSVFSGDIETGYTTTNATNKDGDPLSMFLLKDMKGGVTINGSSMVIFPDFETANGVVHVVDQVIGLPTIVTFATADPNFSSLVGALTSEGQPDFVGILGDPASDPFTVFAPVNEAFEILPETTEEFPTGFTGEVLTSILLHHVVGGLNVRSGDLVVGLNELRTLEGDFIGVELPATRGGIADIVDGLGNIGSIIAVDVQAVNGVIHGIDVVLLPDVNN